MHSILGKMVSLGIYKGTFKNYSNKDSMNILLENKRNLNENFITSHFKVEGNVADPNRLT